MASSVCVSDQRGKKSHICQPIRGEEKGGGKHCAPPGPSSVNCYYYEKQTKPERSQVGQTPVSQGSRAMWRRFSCPFAKLASIYFYLLIAALVCDKFVDTNSNERYGPLPACPAGKTRRARHWLCLILAPATRAAKWHDVNHRCAPGFIWCDRPPVNTHAARPSLHHFSTFQLVAWHESDRLQWSSVRAQMTRIQSNQFISRDIHVGSFVASPSKSSPSVSQRAACRPARGSGL